MTDKDFAERDRKVPGYIDAIYIMDWTATSRYKKIAEQDLPKMAPKRKPTEEELVAVGGPRRTRKRAGDKVAIAFKNIDATKESFKETLRKEEHRPSECWINTIYDNFNKLLRADKTKNIITMETALEVLNRTEENITDGLTIDEILPFFETYS